MRTIPNANIKGKPVAQIKDLNESGESGYPNKIALEEGKSYELIFDNKKSYILKYEGVVQKGIL